MNKNAKHSTHLVSVRVPDDIYQSICTEAKKKRTNKSTIINNRLQTATFYGPEILSALIKLQEKVNSIPNSVDITEEVNNLWQYL